jgi:hypothetical protein
LREREREGWKGGGEGERERCLPSLEIRAVPHLAGPGNTQRADLTTLSLLFTICIYTH